MVKRGLRLYRLRVKPHHYTWHHWRRRNITWITNKCLCLFSFCNTWYCLVTCFRGLCCVYCCPVSSGFLMLSCSLFLSCVSCLLMKHLTRFVCSCRLSVPISFSCFSEFIPSVIVFRFSLCHLHHHHPVPTGSVSCACDTTQDLTQDLFFFT